MRDRAFYRPAPRQGCENIRIRRYDDVPGSEVFVYEDVKGKPYAAAFAGKRTKPDFHFRFLTEESREKKISQWLAGQRSWLADQAERRKKLNSAHDFKPGQIFVESWGYEQTNIDYYMLTELRGKTMGYIVPIGSKLDRERSKPPSDLVSPDPDVFREWDVLLGVDREDSEKGKWKRLRSDGFTVSKGHFARPCSKDSVHRETSTGWGH